MARKAAADRTPGNRTGERRRLNSSIGEGNRVAGIGNKRTAAARLAERNGGRPDDRLAQPVVPNDVPAEGSAGKVRLQGKRAVNAAGRINAQVGSGRVDISQIGKVVSLAGISPIGCALAQIGIQGKGLDRTGINDRVLNGAGNLPIVKVYLQPYRNFWDCNVIDERTEIAGYTAADPENLGDPSDLYANTTGAGKGELVQQTLTVYWDQAPPAYTDTTEAELAEYPVYLPLAAGEDSDFYADDIRLYPRGDFQPWRWGFLRGYIVKGDMLCSLSARNIRADLLGVRAFSPDGSGSLEILTLPATL